MSLFAVAWFISYIGCYLGLIYFGFRWAYEMQSAPAFVLWFLLVSLYAAVGAYVAIALKPKSANKE